MKAATLHAPTERRHHTRTWAHWPDSVWEPAVASALSAALLLPIPYSNWSMHGKTKKPNSFPTTRQKQSLFPHRKGENILTNACVLDGWQSCHGKEAAAPFGDGRWGVGSGNFWALLAAQVWRRATNPPLLAAKQCLNTSRLTPNARWLLLWNKFGIWRPEPIGEVAQPIFTSIISTARYLMGCFCTDWAPAQPGKSPLPPAPRRSLHHPGAMLQGARCNTYLGLPGCLCGILLSYPHTHHPPFVI